MNKWILSLVFIGCTVQASAQTADEIACLQKKPELQNQITVLHVDGVKQEMTSMLMQAYRRFGAPITADKIIFSAPQISFVEDPSLKGPDTLSTSIIAKVDAGPNAIMAQGTSSFKMAFGVDRENQADELGRITGTKLNCALVGEYYSVQLINVTTKQVIELNEDIGVLEVNAELP